MSGQTTWICILHVDDDPAFGVDASILQRRSNGSIESDKSASDGRARRSETKFDCIVSDSEVLDQNGIEFLDVI